MPAAATAAGSALFAASWPAVARRSGRDGALRLRRALERTVDDVGRFCAEHGVDAGFAKGGTLTFARGAAQEARLRAEYDADRAWGGDDTVWLSAAEATARVAVARVRGAVFTPHCAAVQPARLVRGLAAVVERQGGRIVERTTAREVRPGSILTDSGTIHADVVVPATEGYTAGLPGRRRELVPLWSLVVATEPLDAAVWDALGWQRRETVSDGRHLLVYAQRSADGRVVFGGRGAPYRLASGTTGSAGHAATHAALEAAMRELFPALARARVTHRWGGVLGVARDWMPSVGFDRASGLGWAGGYVGDGVGCSALAGATLADLILGRSTDLTTLPWVGHRSRRWEPEPLRWLGIRGSTAAMRIADALEAHTGRPSRLAGAVGRLTGH